MLLSTSTFCDQLALPFSLTQSCEEPGSGHNIREFLMTATCLANIHFTTEALEEFVFFVEE